MKNMLVKAGVLAFSLAMILTMFSACGSKEAVVDAEKAAAPNTVVEASFVTLVVDGREITVEDTAGKTLQQLLDQARITLEDGELLALSAEQVLDDPLTIWVIRQTGEPKPTESEPEPTETEPVEPEPTEPEPEPTETERTVVSVEVYEDCDGSGHGVKVITYSDGTQEEVYF